MLRNRKKSIKQIFTSIVFIFLAILTLIMICISLFKVIEKNHALNEKTERLKTELENKKKENTDTAASIQYLSTSSYQEKEAKKKLNLQKPDEKVIFIFSPENKNKTQVENINNQSILQKLWQNLKTWWQYFFH